MPFTFTASSAMEKVVHCLVDDFKLLYFFKDTGSFLFFSLHSLSRMDLYLGLSCCSCNWHCQAETLAAPHPGFQTSNTQKVPYKSSAEDLSNHSFLYFHIIFSPSLTAKCGKRDIGNKDKLKNVKPKQPNPQKQQTTQSSTLKKTQNQKNSPQSNNNNNYIS